MNLVKYEDEWYIMDGDDLYGKVLDMERDNYWLIWEDDPLVRIPLHGFDDVERYVKKHYKEHEPT
jgi:hypothetical protein